MNRKILYGLAVLAIAVVAAFNMNISSKGDGLSDLSLANVEALAQTETTEEFKEFTGCDPKLTPSICKGKNCKTYSYASGNLCSK